MDNFFRKQEQKFNNQEIKPQVENLIDKIREMERRIHMHECVMEHISKTLENILSMEAHSLFNQLETKNNPQPKLSIEKIPPISFLSK